MYVKLFGSILQSSVWAESPSTRLVWITMLLLADEDGFVKGVESAIARSAAVSKEECRVALNILEAPDLESQSQEWAGRRVEKVEGGWQVLNYTKYREYRTREQVKAADRQRRKYNRDKQLPEEPPPSAREDREDSRSSASLSASASGTASERELVAIAEYRGKGKRAAGFDLARGVATEKHGPERVHAALLDMAMADARFSPKVLEAFCINAKLPPMLVTTGYTPPPPWCDECRGILDFPEGGKRMTMMHKPECSRRTS